MCSCIHLQYVDKLYEQFDIALSPKEIDLFFTEYNPSQKDCDQVQLGVQLQNLVLTSVHLKDSVLVPSSSIPKCVYLLCQDILTYHLSTVGLFRRSATNRQLASLRTNLLRFHINNEPSHAVASLIKELFHSLPVSLIPPCLWPSIEKIADIAEEESKLKALHMLLMLLPPIHLATFRYMCRVLQKVEQSKANKMTTEGLALIMTPAFFFKPASHEDFDKIKKFSDLMQLLITNPEQIGAVPAPDTVCKGFCTHRQKALQRQKKKNLSISTRTAQLVMKTTCGRCSAPSTTSSTSSDNAYGFLKGTPKRKMKISTSGETSPPPKRRSLQGVTLKQHEMTGHLPKLAGKHPTPFKLKPVLSSVKVDIDFADRKNIPDFSAKPRLERKDSETGTSCFTPKRKKKRRSFRLGMEKSKVQSFAVRPATSEKKDRKSSLLNILKSPFIGRNKKLSKYLKQTDEVFTSQTPVHPTTTTTTNDDDNIDDTVTSHPPAVVLCNQSAMMSSSSSPTLSSGEQLNDSIVSGISMIELCTLPSPEAHKEFLAPPSPVELRFSDNETTPRKPSETITPKKADATITLPVTSSADNSKENTPTNTVVTDVIKQETAITRQGDIKTQELQQSLNESPEPVIISTEKMVVQHAQLIVNPSTKQDSAVVEDPIPSDDAPCQDDSMKMTMLDNGRQILSPRRRFRRNRSLPVNKWNPDGSSKIPSSSSRQNMTPTRSAGIIQMTPTRAEQIVPGSVRDKVEKFEGTSYVPRFSLLMSERRTTPQKQKKTISSQSEIAPRKSVVQPYVEGEENTAPAPPTTQQLMPPIPADRKPVIRRRSKRLAGKSANSPLRALQQLSPLPCNSPGIRTFSLRSDDGKPKYNLLTDQTNSPTVARTNSLDRGTPRKMRSSGRRKSNSFNATCFRKPQSYQQFGDELGGSPVTKLTSKLSRRSRSGIAPQM